MQPGSEWIVEFAARESQAREQRAWKRDRHDEGRDRIVPAPSFGQRCLGGVGYLLLVVGAWLNRRAGEDDQLDEAISALRDRRVERRTPSWT